jgi:hypothetical protein
VEESGRGLIPSAISAFALKDRGKPLNRDQDNRYSGRYLNPGPPEYEVELSALLRRSVILAVRLA